MTKAEENYTIWIDADMRSDVPPKAKCTCGWETEPTSELGTLGRLAFEHRDVTGHGLRQHEVHDDD